MGGGCAAGGEGDDGGRAAGDGGGGEAASLGDGVGGGDWAFGAGGGERAAAGLGLPAVGEGGDCVGGGEVPLVTGTAHATLAGLQQQVEWVNGRMKAPWSARPASPHLMQPSARPRPVAASSSSPVAVLLSVVEDQACPTGPVVRKRADAIVIALQGASRSRSESGNVVRQCTWTPTAALPRSDFLHTLQPAPASAYIPSLLSQLQKHAKSPARCKGKRRVK